VGRASLSWQGEIEFADEKIDDDVEVLGCSVAAGFGFLRLRRLDEAGEAFKQAVADFGVEPAQDAVLMALDGAGGVDNRGEAAVGRPEVPFLEEGGRSDGGGLVVELLEGEADLIGARGLQVAAGEGLERGASRVGERRRVAQPEIAGVCEEEALGFLLVAADAVDGIVDDLDSVELVEGHGGVGQTVGGALDEGGAHADADLSDGVRVAAMGSEIGSESLEGAGVLAGNGEQHAGTIEIGEQGDVVVATAGRGLVEGDAVDGGEIGPRGFTLLFEALVMVLVQAMPVVARLPGEHDNQAVAHHPSLCRERPLPGRAQGRVIRRMPQALQRTRGTRA